MKAVVKVKEGPGNIAVQEIVLPKLKKDEVTIEIAFSGLCGTDLHIYHDTFMNFPPVVLGHEFSGIITKVGESVKTLSKGDRVTVLPSTAETCKKCDYCRTGNYMFCENRRGLGYAINGSFTQYVNVREDMVYVLPDHTPLEVGALAEPLACVIHALEELTDIRIGDRVLVSGPGPIGLLCLAVLVGRGLEVTVTGTTEDAVRLEKANEIGAFRTIDVQKENLNAYIAESVSNGFDVVIECSGSEAAVNSGLEAVKKKGKFIQVGITGRKISLDYDRILFKELQLYGSVGHCLSSWNRVIKVFDQNKVELSKIITDKFPIEKWQEAFDLAESKKSGKILLQYN